MSLLAHIMRRLGYIRLTDYGLGLRPDGRLVSLAGAGDLHGLDLAEVPTEGFDVTRLLGESAAAPATPRPRLAAGSPPPLPATAAAGEEDWDRVVAEAKARAEAVDAAPPLTAPPLTAPPLAAPPATTAPSDDGDDGDDDWERLVAEAKARAELAATLDSGALPTQPAASADDVTRVTAPVNDEQTSAGYEPPTRVEAHRDGGRGELCLEETAGGVSTKIIDLARHDPFGDEPATNAVRRIPAEDDWDARAAAASARADADEERRRRAASEARRLAQRPRRPTLTATPVTRPTSRPAATQRRPASRPTPAATEHRPVRRPTLTATPVPRTASRPASEPTGRRLASGTKPPVADSEDTVTTVAIRLDSKRAPLRPAPGGAAPLPRLTTRLGKQPAKIEN